MTPSDVLPFRRPSGAHEQARAGRGTGIVMMNLGGPATLDEVQPFLLRLFADKEIIQVPWQVVLGKFIATRRAPKVRTLYDAIGGGSPILTWTKAEGEAMCARLDEMSPETAPHKFYVSFRYAPPSRAYRAPANCATSCCKASSTARRPSGMSA
jgi:ferrochelatase